MTDWFAGDVAARYDESTAGMPVEPVVDFLLPFAGGGALELAIGTGRIAVPLAARGVRVAGIDFSADMVAELRKKTDAIASRRSAVPKAACGSASPNIAATTPKRSDARTTP